MDLRERIEIPETKPAFEVVRGRLLQKVSPKRAHAQLQGRWLAALAAWAGERGDALPEWRFYFAPPGAAWGSLVPDVGFVWRERLGALSPAAAQEPPFAPDVAVEILSPGDRPRDVAWKIAAYLGGGSQLVAVTDARTRSVGAHDPGGERRFSQRETFEHPALPGFSLDLAALFDGVYRG